MDGYLGEPYRIRKGAAEVPVLSKLPGLSRRVRMALRFLEREFCSGTRLSDAARHVKIRPDSLGKLVRGELLARGIHFTIPEYLSLLRITRAEHLFTSDPLRQCKEVAALIGLSTRHLERLFLRFNGLTPTEYARRVAEAQPPVDQV
jgi:transcriptional regulator GlxA family with amidase domain